MQGVSIKKLQHSIDLQVLYLLKVGGFSFSQFLDHNEKSSAHKSKRGIVSSMLHGF